MERLRTALRDLVSYFKGIVVRRKRRKKEKKDDPFIYPIF